MELQQQIESFLAGSRYAVVGASNDRAKYGNKVLRAYKQVGREVVPVHPTADRVEGLQAFAHLSDLPQPVHGISIVTPPRVTNQVVDEAVELGIRHIWMQPGAESEAAVDRAAASGANVIAGGPCVLVALQFRE